MQVAEYCDRNEGRVGGDYKGFEGAAGFERAGNREYGVADFGRAGVAIGAERGVRDGCGGKQ